MGSLGSSLVAEVLEKLFFHSHRLYRYQRLLQFSLRVLATTHNFELMPCVSPLLDVLHEVFAAFLLAVQPVLPDDSGTATDLAELSNLGVQTSIVADWHPFLLLQTSDLICESS